MIRLTGTLSRYTSMHYKIYIQTIQGREPAIMIRIYWRRKPEYPENVTVEKNQNHKH